MELRGYMGFFSLLLLFFNDFSFAMFHFSLEHFLSFSYYLSSSLPRAVLGSGPESTALKKRPSVMKNL